MGSLLQDVLGLFAKKKYAPIPYILDKDDYLVLSTKDKSSLNVMAYLPKVEQTLVSTLILGAAITGASNTSYDYTSAQDAGNVDLVLTGSDATIDIVTLIAGNNITLSDDGSNNVTINSAAGGGSMNSFILVAQTGMPSTISNGDVVSIMGGAKISTVVSPVTMPSGGGTGSVTSVDATVDGTAITVTGGPITSTGVLSFSYTGSANQFIDGTGALQTVSTGAVASVTGGFGIDITGTPPDPIVNIDYNGVDNAIIIAPTAAIADTDYIWFSDVTDNNIKKTLVSNLPGGSSGVTQILAGTNINISPGSGLGIVGSVSSQVNLNFPTMIGVSPSVSLMRVSIISYYKNLF